MEFLIFSGQILMNPIITPQVLRFKLNSLDRTCTSLNSIMQLTKTIFPDSTTFIEKKRVENRWWRKNAFCGEKVKNAGEKKIHHMRCQWPVCTLAFIRACGVWSLTEALSSDLLFPMSILTNERIIEFQCACVPHEPGLICYTDTS